MPYESGPIHTTTGFDTIDFRLLRNVACAVTFLFCCIIRVDPVSGTDRRDGLPENARPTVFEGYESTRAWTHEQSLYLIVDPSVVSEPIRFPRLANVIESAHWLHDETRRVNVASEPAEWSVNPASAGGNSGIVVIRLDTVPVRFVPPMIVRPSENGIIELPAKMAETRGEKIRFEPQPHKNTVGYWAVQSDSTSWNFQVTDGGLFEIDILQGCGNGHGGSEVELRVGDERMTFTVVETGHFQNFIWRTLQPVRLKPTESVRLELVAISKPGGAVMDVRAIRLVPMGQEREFHPQLAAPDLLPDTVKATLPETR